MKCGACAIVDCVIGFARRSSTYKRGAGDEIRTHDNHVGNVVLYQLSYARAMFYGNAVFSVNDCSIGTIRPGR